MFSVLFSFDRSFGIFSLCKTLFSREKNPQFVTSERSQIRFILQLESECAGKREREKERPGKLFLNLFFEAVKRDDSSLKRKKKKGKEFHESCFFFFIYPTLGYYLYVIPEFHSQVTSADLTK